MLRERMPAKKRYDEEVATEIRRNIKKEANKKKFRRLKLTMGNPRSATAT